MGCVEYGVPQGSILGLQLLFIYINDWPSNTKSNALVLFVDDTSFLFVGEDDKELLYETKAILEQVGNWLYANNFKINADKTQYLTFEFRPKYEASIKF